MNLLIFATVHSLINYTNLIDSCQAHLPLDTLRTSNSFARSDTDVVIDREPHLSRTCKTCLLFCFFLFFFSFFADGSLAHC